MRKILEKIVRKLLSGNSLSPLEIAQIHKRNGVRMGANCQIFGDVSFGSEPYLVKMGNDVKITAMNQFITHDGGINVLRNLQLLPNADKFGQINLGNNVFIGIRCIIMPGVTIGDNVVIGAGSVVTKDIPSNTVAAGVPCKVIKTIDEYYSGMRNDVDYTKQLNPEKKQEYLVKKYNLSETN